MCTPASDLWAPGSRARRASLLCLQLRPMRQASTLPGPCGKDDPGRGSLGPRGLGSMVCRGRAAARNGLVGRERLLSASQHTIRSDQGARYSLGRDPPPLLSPCPGHRAGRPITAPIVMSESNNLKRDSVSFSPFHTTRPSLLAHRVRRGRTASPVRCAGQPETALQELEHAGPATQMPEVPSTREGESDTDRELGSQAVGLGRALLPAL